MLRVPIFQRNFDSFRARFQPFFNRNFKMFEKLSGETDSNAMLAPPDLNGTFSEHF